MALTKEQIEELKEQLRSQVKDMPGQQKEASLNQINSMSDEAIESMLSQQQQTKASGSQDKNVYRSILDKEIPATIVKESEEGLAVLDINPISEGHTMVIPKSAVLKTADLPESVLDFAKSVGKNIQSKLDAKEIHIESQESFGEIVVHIIPVYNKPLTLKSERSKASPEELAKVLEKINKEIIKISREPIKIVKKKTRKKKPLKLDKRIP